MDNLNITHIPVEELDVDVNGATLTVLPSNEAYLVAVSDSKNNKPILFSRRKLDGIQAVDTTVDTSKERAVIDTGNMINVATNRKFSKGKAGFQEYGAVMLNNKVVAKY